jgi:hypothetical protein
MHSTALSTVVALPVDEASRKLREYTYRSIVIGRALSPERMVTLEASDDVTESGDIEFFVIDAGHTRVVLTLASRTDELNVTRRYSRVLEGYRLFAEGGAPAAIAPEVRERRAA